MFGFSAAPTILEVAAWLTYLVVALTVFCRFVRSPPRSASSPAAHPADEPASV